MKFPDDFDKTLLNVNEDIIVANDFQKKSRQAFLIKLEVDGNKKRRRGKNWFSKPLMPIVATVLFFGMLTTGIMIEWESFFNTSRGNGPFDFPDVIELEYEPIELEVLEENPNIDDWYQDLPLMINIINDKQVILELYTKYDIKGLRGVIHYDNQRYDLGIISPGGTMSMEEVSHMFDVTFPLSEGELYYVATTGSSELGYKNIFYNTNTNLFYSFHSMGKLDGLDYNQDGFEDFITLEEKYQEPSEINVLNWNGDHFEMANVRESLSGKNDELAEKISTYFLRHLIVVSYVGDESESKQQLYQFNQSVPLGLEKVNGQISENPRAFMNWNGKLYEISGMIADGNKIQAPIGIIQRIVPEVTDHGSVKLVDEEFFGLKEGTDVYNLWGINEEIALSLRIGGIYYYAYVIEDLP